MPMTPGPFSEAEIAYRRERIMSDYRPRAGTKRRLRFPRRRQSRS
jgi:hypothetical protein